MRYAALLMAAGLGIAAAGAAAPAAAQSWTRADVWAQRDRPGDWRCDAFWDANRTDCGAAWRDQRHRATRSWSSYGDGYRDGRYRTYGRSQGYGYGYGSGYGYGPGHGSGEAYYGAYGRPDLVYPEGGHGYGGTYGGSYGGRDPHRIDWCRSRYRSYDPGSGYYRAYSGRLVWCG